MEVGCELSHLSLSSLVLLLQVIEHWLNSSTLSLVPLKLVLQILEVSITKIGAWRWTMPISHINRWVQACMVPKKTTVLNKIILGIFSFQTHLWLLLEYVAMLLSYRFVSCSPITTTPKIEWRWLQIPVLQCLVMNINRSR